LWRTWIDMISSPYIALEGRAVAVPLRLPTFGSVLVTSVYAPTGGRDHMGVTYDDVMAAVTDHVRCVGLPFLLAGDYNVPISDTLSWCAREFSIGCTTGPGQPTCSGGHSGHAHRELDYFIIDSVLSGLANQPHVVQELGLAPHWGVEVRLEGARVSERVNVLKPVHPGQTLPVPGPRWQARWDSLLGQLRTAWESVPVLPPSSTPLRRHGRN